LMIDISDSEISPLTDNITSYTNLAAAVLYTIFASLTKTSNIILFLAGTYLVAILLNFITSLRLSEVPFLNLGLIWVISLVFFFKSLFLIKRNAYLKLIIFFMTFFVLSYFIAIWLKLFLPALGFYKFINPLFIIATLGLIFGLPNSNFSEWRKDHQGIFIKAVLSVWLLLFIISSSMSLIRDNQYLKSLVYPDLTVPWFMEDYSVGIKPGMNE
jgi:hypothetical protein